MNIDLACNFQRIYKLEEHISCDKNRIYSNPEIKLLFAETNNKCGSCQIPLDWFDDNEINSKSNQIAHIYGKKLFALNDLPLDKNYHINCKSEINKYHNLIILCDTCHKEYDATPTYEKYVRILDYKEKIYHRVTSKRYIYFALEDIVNKIKNGAFDTLTSTSAYKVSEFEKMRLEDKLRYNNISNLKSSNIIDYMMRYFYEISEITSNFDNERDILKQYNIVYLELKKLYPDKNHIISIINSSLITEVDSIFNDIIPILTAYMIMICEVLDNVT